MCSLVFHIPNDLQCCTGTSCGALHSIYLMTCGVHGLDLEPYIPNVWWSSVLYMDYLWSLVFLMFGSLQCCTGTRCGALHSIYLMTFSVVHGLYVEPYIPYA